MPLRVHVCCSYAPSADARTRDHWSALHFVKAIKGTPLMGRADIPISPHTMIDLPASSGRLAPVLFARMALAVIDGQELLPAALVPVPDAACDISARRPSRTYALAEALAHAWPAPRPYVLDVLRWVRPMPPAHCADGTRDPQVLYGRLRLTDRLRDLSDTRLVLVDDVVASGGHLRAAAAFLTDWGAAIAGAVCAAAATYDDSVLVRPFQSRTIVLPDFCPDPDWLLPEIYDGVQL